MALVVYYHDTCHDLNRGFWHIDVDCPTNAFTVTLDACKIGIRGDFVGLPFYLSGNHESLEKWEFEMELHAFTPME